MPDIDRTLLETRCFLEAIGVRVWIDEFDELQVDVPEIPAEDVRRILLNRSEQLRKLIVDRAAYERRQFIGGPLNGQRCGVWQGRFSLFEMADKFQFSGRLYVHHVARAKWAAYVGLRNYSDGRMFWAGNETSKPKAVNLAVRNLETAARAKVKAQ